MTRHVGPLVRPAHEPAPDGAIHRIRPADAGWRFVSFDVHRLAAGERVARAGDGQEVLVLVLEGTASVSVGGVGMGAVGTRATVFDEAPAGVVLCAPGEDVEVSPRATSCSASRPPPPGTSGARPSSPPRRSWSRRAAREAPSGPSRTSCRPRRRRAG